MTAAQYCRVGLSVALPVFSPIPAPQNWLVRYRYSLAGEAPQIAQETVRNVRSEAAAIKGGITQRLGRVNRKLHSLEMLEVRAL